MKKLRGLGSRVLDVEVEKPDDVLKYNGETLVSVACKFIYASTLLWRCKKV